MLLLCLLQVLYSNFSKSIKREGLFIHNKFGIDGCLVCIVKLWFKASGTSLSPYCGYHAFVAHTVENSPLYTEKRVVKLWLCDESYNTIFLWIMILWIMIVIVFYGNKIFWWSGETFRFKFFFNFNFVAFSLFVTDYTWNLLYTHGNQALLQQRSRLKYF